MKTSSICFAFALATSCLTFTACNKESFTLKPGPPRVNAGKDIVVLLPITEAILSGDAYPHYGISTLVSTWWTQISGPSTANIEFPDKYISRISGLKNGTYYFTQTVEDNFGQITEDTVGVFVIEDTISGKIFQFDKVSWNLGGDFGFYYFAKTPSRPDLFFPHTKQIEVQIQYEGAPNWIPVSASNGTDYDIDSNNYVLTVYDVRDVNVSKLDGKKVHVRVIFR